MADGDEQKEEGAAEGDGGGGDAADAPVKCPVCVPGLPGWMATFSDLVTLLLTFFVLLSFFVILTFSVLIIFFVPPSFSVLTLVFALTSSFVRRSSLILPSFSAVQPFFAFP